MHYFIVNPRSKGGKGEQVWGKLEKLLNAWQIEYECYKTEKPGDARTFARELTEGIKEPRIIVAVPLHLAMFRQVPEMIWPEVSGCPKARRNV